MGAWNEDSEGALAKIQKESTKASVVFGSQDRESRKRAPNATIEGGGDPPHPPTPIAELGLFRRRVLPKSIRGSVTTA